MQAPYELSRAVIIAKLVLLIISTRFQIVEYWDIFSVNFKQSISAIY